MSRDEIAAVTRAGSVDERDRGDHRAHLMSTLGEAISNDVRDEVDRRYARRDLTQAVNESAIKDPSLRERILGAKTAALEVAALQEPDVATLMSGSGSWTVPITAGMTTLGPPYDDGHTESSSATGLPHCWANQGVGKAHAYVGGPGAEEGFRQSIASLSLWVIAGRTGTLEVRPYLKYEYFGHIHAMWLSGWTSGRIDAVAAVNGNAIAHRSKTLWSHESETGHDDWGADTLYLPDILLRVPVLAGTLYTFSFAAVAMRDHSGDEFLGFSTAWSSVDMTIPFVVFEFV